jgi:uncharacterized membrane protein YccC
VTRNGPGASLSEALVPDWLEEVVRLRRDPVPWPAMIRAAVAICAPLAVAIAIGDRPGGLLVAMGGLLGTVVDKGGPYLARFRIVGTAAVLGGAPGLLIGSVIHGRGWIAVVALMGVAGVSAVMSAAGNIGSVTGLQLLVYTALGLGPLGGIRPWWHVALGFLIGAAWALLLTVPAWLLSPRAPEQRSVAAVYRALATRLNAIGSAASMDTRRAVTAAFNTAYDALLTARSAAAGPDDRIVRLGALLNQANLVAEGSATLGHEGLRPPQPVIEFMEAAADAIRDDQSVVLTPPSWGTSPGARTLSDALGGVARLLSGKVKPSPRSLGQKPRPRDRVDAFRERVAGRLTRIFAVRIMACIGVAALMSEVLPLARSYWVVLTVAIVLKPDFGSVFARAVQRGLGTILGAVLGAAILAVIPYGPWLLVPFAILAGLLPYGQQRNYGLFATFLTPLVVLLIDLLTPVGWHLALDRLLDTLLGCAIVLLVGYAPWPSSWQAHLPGQFATTIRAACRYMTEALVMAADDHSGVTADQVRARSQMRRQVHRSLSDLRTEFQRTMSEPAPVSRQATAWWPALVGLEELVGAVTATAVSIFRGAPAPAPPAVRQLAAALDAVADAVQHGTGRPRVPDLPDDEALKPVTEAVSSVLSVLAEQRTPVTP